MIFLWLVIGALGYMAAVYVANRFGDLTWEEGDDDAATPHVP